jgi:hypothetical protein
MKDLAHKNKDIGIRAIVTVLVFVVTQSTLIGCAVTAGRKGSGITNSQEATDQWHSFEILPNHQYYYSGPDARPFYIIAIDDQYHLTSTLWKPIDLTPEQLKKWINIPPRVGYDPQLYGANIAGPNGERIGLWYSVRDWRNTGSASLGENNRVTVTAPARSDERRKGRFSTRGVFDF